MEVSIRPWNNRRIVFVSGEIDRANVDRLADVIQSLIGMGEREVVVEASTVTYLNGAVVHLLSDLLGADATIRFVIVGLPPHVFRVLRVAGIEEKPRLWFLNELRELGAT